MNKTLLSFILSLLIVNVYAQKELCKIGIGAIGKVIDKNYRSYFATILQLTKQQTFEPSKVCLVIMILTAQHVKQNIL